MSKIENIISARMAEASQRAAQSTEAAALVELHQVAVSMSKIADQIGDRMNAMEAQVRMLNAPKPAPKPRPPLPWYERPVALMQVLIGLLAILMASSLISGLWPERPTACQPAKKPGALICKKI